jgi:hypothetical protein
MMPTEPAQYLINVYRGARINLLWAATKEDALDAIDEAWKLAGVDRVVCHGPDFAGPCAARVPYYG